MKRPRNILLSLLALKPDEIALHATPTDSLNCRSNSTHVVWKVPFSSHEQSTQRRLGSIAGTYQCTVQTRKDAEKTCLDFLRNHVMPFDEPFLETMGFPLDDDDEDIDTDGLANGLVQPTIALALEAKIRYKWTDDLPPLIFFNYVLNYANLNEARTNWRPLLVDALKFNESELYQNSLDKDTQESNLDISSVTTWVNQHLWTKLARNEDQPIFFKPSQTPLIFDPMSTIAFGYASCTGTSILFANALRAVGVPARVVGTPAWYGNRTDGNHNWVEVILPNTNGDWEWNFLEPSPALPDVDTLDNDPCGRWFCDSSRFPSSKVYAATLSYSDTHFPLAWELDCQGVPAEDRSDYYSKICGSCNKDGEEQE